MTFARMLVSDSGGETTGRGEVLVVARHADVGQIFGDAVARDDAVEFLPAFQFAAVLRGEVAVAAQAARDLPRAVGAEVEVDANIAVANGAQRFAAVVGQDERDDELVGHAAVVRVLHALHCVRVAATFRIAEDHGVECLLLAVPFFVAVHGIVAPTDAGDLSDVVLAHLLLQLLDVARAVGGQRVASIHEAVHEDALHAVLLGHAQQRVKMVLVRVHAAVRKQPEQVQPPVPGAGLGHRIEQHRVFLEFTVLDHEIDLGDVHVHDAPGADVEVADLAVAHLPGGQPDIASAGVDQRVGELGQQAIVIRFARQ